MAATDRRFATATEADLPALKRLMHHAFASPPEGAERWVQQAGFGEFRVVAPQESATAEACLLRIPMGQYFGGRSVPMVGIAGVAVAPEARGRGTARWMMSRTLEESREQGFALSALYASTQALYRSVGYEQAGHYATVRLPTTRIDARDRAAEVRPLLDSDDAAVKRCYAGFAGTFNGMLDRGTYCWSRVRLLREQPFAGFGVANSRGELDGYLYLTQTRAPGSMEAHLQVSDFAFITAQAGRRMLGFLADFSTTVASVVLPGGVLPAISSLMDAHHYTIDRHEIWMLRILDVARALEARGYPSCIAARLFIEVEDAVLADNAGGWVLVVAGGRGTVRRESSSGTLRCSVRGLAAIYAGLYTATQARLLGWISGDDEVCRTADAVFGGAGVPRMTDFF